jgi:hypothetical protein
MKKTYCILLAMIWALVLRPGLCPAQQITASTMRRSYDPVQAPGELLKKFHGARLNTLRLYSCRDGRLQPMVYQFDERLENGVYIFNLGTEANAHLANNTLDPQDMLLFRIEDTGDHAPEEAWPVKDGLEIELVDPLDKGRSYCYLLRFSGNAPARIIANTMELEHFNPWENPDLPIILNARTYSVAGTITRVNKRVYKSFLVKSFKVPPSAGGSGQDFIDGMRTRAFIELLWGQFRIDLNEDNVIGGVDQIGTGDVRGYGRQWFTMPLPLGIEGPRLHVDVFTYERMIVTPMLFRMPFNPGYIITRGGLSIGFDLNEHARGMKLYTPNCMQGLVVDGKMTDDELNLSKDWVPWYVLTGPQGTLIIRVHADPTIIKEGTITLEYTDDRNASFPPEDEPGTFGYARGALEFTDFDPGYYPLRYEWYFPPDFYRPEGLNQEMLTEFLNILDAPLIIRAEGKEAKNMAMNPPPLVPKK